MDEIFGQETGQQRNIRSDDWCEFRNTKLYIVFISHVSDVWYCQLTMIVETRSERQLTEHSALAALRGYRDSAESEIELHDIVKHPELYSLHQRKRTKTSIIVSTESFEKVRWLVMKDPTIKMSR